MTDWTPEEDEAFNMVEKQSNLGKQILREMGQPYHFEKREWVGLTDEEKQAMWARTKVYLTPKRSYFQGIVDSEAEYGIKENT